MVASERQMYENIEGAFYDEDFFLSLIFFCTKEY